MGVVACSLILTSLWFATVIQAQAAQPDVAELEGNTASSWALPQVSSPVIDSAGVTPAVVSASGASLSADTLVTSPTAGATPPVIATATPVALNRPVNLIAEAGGKKILLAWEPIAGPAGAKIAYHVFRGLEKPIYEPEGDAPWPKPLNSDPLLQEYFLDAPGNSKKPPEANRTYYYAVMAVDDQGHKSPLSESLRVVNVAELSPPTGLQGQPGDRSVLLSWIPSFSGGPNGLAGYILYRSEQEQERGTPVLPRPITADNYTDKGADTAPLVNGQTYYYTLLAQDTKGMLSEPAGPIAVSPLLAVSAPQNLTAAGKTDDMIELKWSPSQDGSFKLQGYNIYRQSDVEQEPVKINKELCTGNMYIDSAQNSTVQPLLGRFYTYTVRAVDEMNNEGADSAPAKSGPKIPMAVPATGLISTSIPGLPPESSLTISGRKKIDVSFTQVTAMNVSKDPLTGQEGPTERYPSIHSGLTKGFNLEQELQVRLEGKVGKKITVDVDYDDTKEEQRKISIIYAGDPDEVIQEAAFGDILLDLPRTEFAGYNKNLFGAKIKVALNDFRFTAIGAQTKGITVTEKFKGNTSPRMLEKQDVAFTAFRYYYITKDWPVQVNHPELPGYDAGQPRHGIVPGSEKVYVTNGVMTSDTITVTGTAYGQEIRFNLLSSGVDYTLDYDRGVITFVNTVQPTWFISVAYRYLDAAGNEQAVGYNGTLADFSPVNLQVPPDGHTSDAAHLIQSYNAATNAKDYRMMLMNRYSLGYQNILDPQSDPDFAIKVYYSNGQEYSPQLPQPTDTQNAEQYYRIDPTFGTVQFTHSYPFQEKYVSDTNNQFFADSYYDNRTDAYNTLGNPNLTYGADSTNYHKFTIRVEFKNLITTFQLSHWNIIKNSEIIKKDGTKLQRNTDYYIDYDIGLVTFISPESIASSTEITVTYEYLPFGGKFQSNLFGARAEYDLWGKKLSVGSTFLYNASQAPLDIPDIRSTPTSLSLLDGDVKFSLNPVDFGEVSLPLVGSFTVPLTMDVTAETAYSSFQTNTYRKAGEDGVAMVDGMEGADEIRYFETSNNNWFPASAPAIMTDPDNRRYIYQTDAFEVGHAPVDSNDKSHQLRWYYTDLSAQTWDAFVYPLSTTGSNLHEYRNIEMWVYCPPSAQNVMLRIDLGVIPEDSNGNGNLNFEGDGHIFSPDVDQGIVNTFDNKNLVPPTIKSDPSAPNGIYPGGAFRGYWGENNNRLNSEDLDQDDELDSYYSYYEYQSALVPGQWNAIQIPLSDFSAVRYNTPAPPDTNPQSPSFMSYIKHMRLWVTSQSNTPTSSYIQFESIQLTGNKWQPTGLDVYGNPTIEPAAGTLNATSVSLETDPSYVPETHFYIYDEDQEKEELQNERALKVEFNGIDRNTTVSGANTMPAFYITRSLTASTTGYDYTGYRQLRLDVFKKKVSNPGQILFVRLGLDPYNFYQYEFDLDEAAHGAWHTFAVELDGSDGRRKDFFSNTIISRLGQIKEISIGIINPGVDGDSSSSGTEVIWINNLRVTGGETREGMAYRVTSNTSFSDIMTVNSDWRDVDSDFYTIDESPQGKQHSTTSKVSGNITKLSWLPISLSWNRSANFTELEHRDDPSFSNNFSNPDVVNETVNGGFSYNQLQGLDMSLATSQSRRNTTYIDQISNVNNLQETFSATPSVSYTLPAKILNFPLGATTFTGRYAYTDTHLKYDQDGVQKLKRTDLWDRWKQSKEETYTYQGSYSPLFFLRMTPSFTYAQTSDRGHLSWYRFYAALDTKYNPENKQYFSEIYRMSKIDKIAKINMNILNVPVISPTVSYAMTNSRDYINDTLLLPGTLNLQSGLALGELIGWNQFPRFNLSQNYTTSATYRNELEADPIGQLDFEHMWVINPSTFKDKDPLFNTAYINSRTISESASTSIGLIPDVNLTPQYTDSWTRKMTSQNNFNTTLTMSVGSGLVWSRVPSFTWLNIQNLSLDYRYSENSTLDSADREIMRNITHSTTASLPLRIFTEISSNLSAGLIQTIRLSGEKLDVAIYEDTYTGGISLSYNLHMDTPFILPNFWPFNGAVLKLQQTLRLSNTFNMEFARNREVNVSGNKKTTDTFTNDTTVNYSLWKNVEGDVSITNQWFYDQVNANKDYWAIRIKAGLTAIF
ncbi:hypothetical protein JW933_07335 [candidate division FCPU426 bacterium]|nr:hypothetical protein [candidate division FCPU426 bacterium]